MFHYGELFTDEFIYSYIDIWKNNEDIFHSLFINCKLSDDFIKKHFTKYVFQSLRQNQYINQDLVKKISMLI